MLERYREPAPQTRDDYLTKEQQKSKLTRLEALVDKSRFIEDRMRKELKEIGQRREKMTDLFKDSTSHADVLAVVNNIKVCHDLLTFLGTLTGNLKKSQKEKRYDEFPKELYHCLSVIRGPQIVKFLSVNLSGPADGTICAIK